MVSNMGVRPPPKGHKLILGGREIMRVRKITKEKKVVRFSFFVTYLGNLTSFGT